MNKPVSLNIKNSIGLLLSIVIFSFLSCKHTPQKKIKPSVKLKNGKEITKTKEEYLKDLSEDFDNEPVVDPMTIQDCNLYYESDTLSAVKNIIPAFTSFERLNYEVQDFQKQLPNNDADSTFYTQYSQVTWYKIRTSTGEEGYIRDMSKIARFTFSDTLSNLKYVISNYANKEGNYMFKFSKYNWANHEILSSVETHYLPEAIQTARVIKSLTLKNAKIVIHLSQHADFCGGGMTNTLVMDTPKGLIMLPENSNSFDDSSYDSVDESVYYPTRDEKSGRIYLCEYDAYSTGISKYNTITYPSNAIIPINELIVQRIESTAPVLDKNEEPVTLKNGQYKMASHTIKNIYYRWDGARLSKFYERTTKLI